MSTSIEIWRSRTSTSDDDFSLLTTVADGAPWSFVDIPTVAGRLYIYKARRVDAGSGLMSAFSPLAYIVGPYPRSLNMLQGIAYNSNPNIGVKVGVGTEPNGTGVQPGQAVKAPRLLALIDIDDTGGGTERIERKDIQAGQPGVTGFVQGPAKYPLKLTCALTPESNDEMLSAGLGAPTTAAVTAPAAPALPVVTQVGAAGAVNTTYKVYARSPQGDSAASPIATTALSNAVLNGTNYDVVTWTPVKGATQYVLVNSTTGHIIAITTALSANNQGQDLGAYAAPAAPAGNQQKWLDTLGTPFTVSLAAYFGTDGSGGVLTSLWPGVRVDKFNLEFDRDAKDPMQIVYDAMAMNEVTGLSLAALGLDVATYDTLDPYAAIFSSVMIGGALASCQKYGVSVDLTLAEKGILYGYAGPVAFYRNAAKNKITMTLYFDNSVEMRRFFNSAATGVAIEQQGIKYFPVEVVTSAAINGGGIVNQFGVYAGYATYVRKGKPVKGRDGCIMQEVEVTPAVDASTGSDLVFTNVNSRSNASIVTAGTAVTGITGNVINPYTN